MMSILLEEAAVPPSPELNKVFRNYLKQSGPVCMGLPRLTQEAAEALGIDTDFGRGYGDFIKSTYGSTRVPREVMAIKAVESLVALNNISDRAPSRSRNFVYLPLDREAPMTMQLARIVHNAEYMCRTFGSEMFTGTSNEAYFRAPIGEGFSITAKGGSGSGAFALDLAIEADKLYDDRDRIRPSHELWRVGVDTSTLSKTQTDVMRIVRTGGAVKGNDTWKQGEFQRFRKVMGTTPQRALTFTAAHLMHGQGFDVGMALSTHGAMELSSLSRSSSDSPTRYSELHESVGFTDAHNPYWHASFNLGPSFYDQFVAEDAEDAGMQPQERQAVDLAIRAFNAMTTYPDDQPFPVKLCQEEDDEILEAALRAFMR